MSASSGNNTKNSESPPPLLSPAKNNHSNITAPNSARKHKSSASMPPPPPTSHSGPSGPPPPVPVGRPSQPSSTGTGSAHRTPSSRNPFLSVQAGDGLGNPSLSTSVPNIPSNGSSVAGSSAALAGDGNTGGNSAYVQTVIDKHARFFQSLLPVNGKLSGEQVKAFFEKSTLPNEDLSFIWKLSDVSRDGKLSLGEFCVAMELTLLRKNGKSFPQKLPTELLEVAHTNVLPTNDAALMDPSAHPPTSTSSAAINQMQMQAFEQQQQQPKKRPPPPSRPPPTQGHGRAKSLEFDTALLNDLSIESGGKTPELMHVSPRAPETATTGDRSHFISEARVAVTDATSIMRENMKESLRVDSADSLAVPESWGGSHSDVSLKSDQFVLEQVADEPLPPPVTRTTSSHGRSKSLFHRKSKENVLDSMKGFDDASGVEWADAESSRSASKKASGDRHSRSKSLFVSDKTPEIERPESGHRRGKSTMDPVNIDPKNFVGSADDLAKAEKKAKKKEKKMEAKAEKEREKERERMKKMAKKEKKDKKEKEKVLIGTPMNLRKLDDEEAGDYSKKHRKSEVEANFGQLIALSDDLTDKPKASSNSAHNYELSGEAVLNHPLVTELRAKPLEALEEIVKRKTNENAILINLNKELHKAYVAEKERRLALQREVEST
eukprot:Nk52_evm32s242 gene=Nk52_evmTU32s242